MNAGIGGDDTIAAIATPPGIGAIAVVRVSGPDALVVADRVFRGKGILSKASGYTVHLGILVDGAGIEIDQVLATVFKDPHSYTGEDSVEISCHGGTFVTHKVLDAVLKSGARMADPGEFTKRAFLNGKLDLSQAEAVADIISAKSERAQQLSLRQLDGVLAKEIGEIREQLVSLCSLLELELDFADEGIELVGMRESRERIGQVSKRVSKLLDSFALGRIERDGATVAIVGKPNVGKSSLFNSLLQHERAIVSPIPGTTRDFIEESIHIEGILFRLLDTAGLRESRDGVEAEGIARTKAIINKADIIIEVRDITTTLAEERLAPECTIAVYNKSDLVPHFSPPSQKVPAVVVSAMTGQGMDSLREQLGRAVSSSNVSDNTTRISSERHKNALERAKDLLEKAQASSSSLAPPEFVAADLRLAADALGEVTGDITTDEILNNIFANFCVGK
jgi:tRNA modification GTPase